MLDTVRLRSPFLDEGTAARAEHWLQRRQGFEISTGELVYSITSGALAGSWDERVSVRVMRDEWVVFEGQRQAIQQPCEPYVLLEGSVHKALLGHNIVGGPLDPISACRWLVADVGRRLDCPFPDGLAWQVQRVDWSEVYELPSYEAVAEYIHALRLAEYPRRTAQTYGDFCVYFPGGTTTVKCYHKGPEFWKHDRKRVKKCLGLQAAGELGDLANRLLRFEIEVHARKLDEDFGHKPTVGELTTAYLQAVHDREAARLLREGQAGMQTVRTHRAVSRRLKQLYQPSLANTLFGTWMQLSALGEDVVKQEMPRATFYRQRKQLVDAGVSWKGADIRCIAQLSAIPEGFSPVRTDPHRLTQEALEVTEKLQPFRAAA